MNCCMIKADEPVPGAQAVLFWDTETCGLPKDYKAPLTDLDNWPRMVQLAWRVEDVAGVLVSESSLVIRPEGFRIPDEAARIHGIDQARAEREGVPLDVAMASFDDDLASVPLAVAHNVPFDRAITGAERLRLNLPWKFTAAFKCTMAEGTNLCKLPGGVRGYKWPTLQELHVFLFGVGFEDAHDALVDVRACSRCYWEMIRRKNVDPRMAAAAV